MNWKNWIPLVLAVVLGLVAAKVARDYLTRTRAAAPAQQKFVKVVVATGPVAPGQELTAAMLSLAAVPADAPPTNGFTNPASIVGRVAGVPLFKGQPVVEECLAPKGAAAGLQALVPRGMRAITVEVNETSGLAGMLAPGCRVDVVSTLSGTGKQDAIACTIVQDVLVQAVGQRLSPAAGGERLGDVARSVTLVVTPHDAEALDLAASMGRPRLVLRGTYDREPSETTGVRFVELRGDDRERVVDPVVALTTPAVTLPVQPPVTPLVTPVVAPPVTPRVTPPATQPTTQPVVVPRTVVAGGTGSDPFAEPARPKRSVTVFRGSARTEVVFDLPAAPSADTAVTKTSNDPIDR